MDPSFPRFVILLTIVAAVVFWAAIMLNEARVFSPPVQCSREYCNFVARCLAGPAVQCITTGPYPPDCTCGPSPKSSQAHDKWPGQDNTCREKTTIYLVSATSP